MLSHDVLDKSDR